MQLDKIQQQGKIREIATHMRDIRDLAEMFSKDNPHREKLMRIYRGFGKIAYEMRKQINNH